MQKKMPNESSDPNVVLVPITSDKGLCGAVNSTIVRELKKIFNQPNINRSKYQIFSIGDKGTAGLTRPFPDCLKTSITKV
jgi:F-type H+-transporting ATPase subunit gamma